MSSEIPVNPSEQDTSTKSEMDILSEGDTQDEPTGEVSTEETDSEEPTSDEQDDTPERDTDETPETDENEPKDEELETEDFESEEDIEAEAKITRPSWGKIKKDYPELAKDKDFKALYFRDLAMSEVFPTVKEAKEASQAAEAFVELDHSLVAGDIDRVVEHLNPQVLDNLAKKIIPALYKIDVKYFQRATQPLIVDVLNNVLDYATEHKDENLRISIRNVSRYLTGKSDVPPRFQDASESPEVKREAERLRNERLNLFRGEEKKFLESTDNYAGKKVRQLTMEGLESRKDLSQFAKSAIVERTIKDVLVKVQADEGLNAKIKSLHKLAARNGFVNSDVFKSRIVAATLDRARKLIPVIRNRHITAALGNQPPKGTNKVVADAKTGEIETSGNKVTSIKQIDTRKTSPEDFLAGKVTLRK